MKLEKTTFIGRSHAATELDTGPRLMRVSLNIDTSDTDVMGDEPIWARIGALDPGCVNPPHDHGAARFDASGTACPPVWPQTDGEWRVVGWVTSGGYGHSVKMSLAQGYLPNSLITTTPIPELQVEILGKRYQAQYLELPPFDPEGSRMRS